MKRINRPIWQDTSVSCPPALTDPKTLSCTRCTGIYDIITLSLLPHHRTELRVFCDHPVLASMAREHDP